MQTKDLAATAKKTVSWIQDPQSATPPRRVWQSVFKKSVIDTDTAAGSGNECIGKVKSVT